MLETAPSSTHDTQQVDSSLQYEDYEDENLPPEVFADSVENNVNWQGEEILIYHVYCVCVPKRSQEILTDDWVFFFFLMIFEIKLF